MSSKPGTGQTTLIKIAASPWGDDLNGALGFITAFSGTVNALEEKCSSAQDILFALDDVQAQTKRPVDRAMLLHDTVHRVSSGQRKLRLGEPAKSWRNISLAGSNESLAKIFADGGMSLENETLVRIPDLPCDNEFGVFSFVPRPLDAAAFAEEVAQEAEAIRGMAGEIFIEHLVNEYAEDEKALIKKLKTYQQELRDELDEYAQDRVAKRVLKIFAVVYAGGCLAHDYKLLPWRRDVLKAAVVETFRRHRAHVSKSAQDQNVTHKLSRYVSQYKGSIPKVGIGQDVDARRLRRARAVKRKSKKGRWEICFTPKQLKSALEPSISLKRGIQQLQERGQLIDESNGGRRKTMLKRRIGGKDVPVYCVSAKALRLAEKKLNGA